VKSVKAKPAVTAKASGTISVESGGFVFELFGHFRILRSVTGQVGPVHGGGRLMVSRFDKHVLAWC